jgi:hypothetical protein
MENEKYLVEAKLDDDTTLLIECLGTSGEEEVGFSSLDLNSFLTTVESFSNSIKSTLEKVSPHKVTVEFGFSVDIKAGKLTAVLVNGEVSANVKISMTWKNKNE